jgi:hypothetical protein
MPWVTVAVFHGTSDEAIALLEAVARNCPNKPPCLGCAAHKAMLDQRWLNHLVFLHRIRERLLKEEGLCVKRSSSSR